MKYPDDYINQIINGDCLDLMKQMPDKCVDLVLTDPPYGIGIDGQKEDINKKRVQIRKGHKFMGWDTQIPSKDYFDEMFRVSKNQVICGANYFTEYLPSGHKGWIVWYKGQQGLTMSDCEIIFTSFDCPTRMFNIHRTHLWQEHPHHPTQKPTKLIKQILVDHTEKDDTIFDPFLGSGTTAVACKELNRNFIGIEINEEYCRIAENRLKQTQGSLF